MNRDNGAAGTEQFLRIHDEFRPKILNYLRRMVGEADAEDLVQEVFMRVSRALGDFRGESSAATWIFRIATNAGLDHLRSHAAGQKVMLPVGPDDETLPGRCETAHACEVPLPDELLLRKDMNDCIRAVLDDLPPTYRTALLLSDVGGLSNAEIVRAEGISPAAVKVRLHRARARLREELHRKCVLYRDARNELACDRRITPPKYTAR